MNQLRIDPARYSAGRGKTNITVACTLPDGSTEAVDIYCLDSQSLLNWLREGGSERMERTVALLLGHSL